MVKVIKKYEEFCEVIKSDKLVVVDFHAKWCGPCKTIAPDFEAFANETSDVEFYKIDVDEVQKAAEHAKVTGMPTFAMYKSGEQVKKVVGANLNLVKKGVNDNK